MPISSEVDSRLDSVAALVVEELIDKLQAGDADVEAFIEAHAEYAERLRRLLPALRVMADLSNSLEDGERRVDGDAAGLGTLGDFRILREIGRGGMGVVYETEQVSLRRRVALKVLPFAATMDPRHLQRFLNEARAAASLHHEHIVPVYAVGCERGVHYYAMQFIEGRSVAELIATHDSASRKREPSQAGAEPDTRTDAAAATEVMPRDAAYFRRVAEWGIQAADALEHAHSRGIVHRDVKPANLIVDHWGKLWVTDFGLARTAADAGLTMTGDLLGTLRYMSPEQALARHGLVDHRTDVYSLGATLYELLTGRPAIEGQDRQDIFKRIADEEPRSLRALERQVPVDLETVVLKALAKEPVERYATARELAEDLRRFLDNRPIQARRPRVLKRLAQYGRRHRGVVWSGGLGLLLAVVVLSVSSVLLWQETNKVKQALAARDAQYQRAERQYRRADNNFNYIMNTTVDFLKEVMDADRPGGPTVAEVRQSLEDRLEQLLQSCQDSAGTDALALRDAAWWSEDVGRFYFWRGDHAKAERKYRTALALYEALVSDHPEEVTIHYPLSRCLWQLGNVRYAAGRTDEARAWYRRSLAEHRLRLQLDPDWRAHADLALFLVSCPLLEFCDAKEALRLALRAKELCPAGDDCWRHLGLAHYRNGNWREAIVSLQESLHRRPKSVSDSFFLAMAHHQLGEKNQAKEYFQRGVEWMGDKRIPKGWQPSIWRYRAEAAEVLGIKDTPPSTKSISPTRKSSKSAKSGR